MGSSKKFDATAWIAEQAKPVRRPCSICKHKEAASAVHTVAEAWAGGAVGINLKKIAEQVLMAGFGFDSTTGQTVQRHLMRCEPKLWEKIDAIRTTNERQ